MLVTGDTVDTFHRWDNSDPNWTETTWFGAWIPEAATSVYVYHWFRPAIGIYGGGCFVWNAGAQLPWDIPAFYYDVNLPIRSRLDLSALALPEGTRIQTVTPGEWVTVTSRHQPSTEEEAVVSVRPYGATTTTE